MTFVARMFWNRKYCWNCFGEFQTVPDNSKIQLRSICRLKLKILHFSMISQEPTWCLISNWLLTGENWISRFIKNCPILIYVGWRVNCKFQRSDFYFPENVYVELSVPFEFGKAAMYNFNNLKIIWAATFLVKVYSSDMFYVTF